MHESRRLQVGLSENGLLSKRAYSFTTYHLAIGSNTSGRFSPFGAILFYILARNFGSGRGLSVGRSA